MRKWVQSYFSFTRSERMGLVALCTLLLVLLAARVTMHYWVHPANMDAEKQKRLSAAWAAFKKQNAADTIVAENQEETGSEDSVVVTMQKQGYSNDTASVELKEIKRYR